MGVALPSDLVADVMRNADPSRANSASKRLQDLSGEANFHRFEAELGRIAEVRTIRSGTPLPDMEGDAHHALGFPGQMSRKESSAHVAFERMVLRNLLESLLPGADTGAFGTGPSAGVWRSMAADELAGLYTHNGGIGIAAMLSRDEGGHSAEHRSDWPYFSTDEIVAFAG